MNNQNQYSNDIIKDLLWSFGLVALLMLGCNFAFGQTIENDSVIVWNYKTPILSDSVKYEDRQVKFVQDTSGVYYVYRDGFRGETRAQFWQQLKDDAQSIIDRAANLEKYASKLYAVYDKEDNSSEKYESGQKTLEGDPASDPEYAAFLALMADGELTQEEYNALDPKKALLEKIVKIHFNIK